MPYVDRDSQGRIVGVFNVSQREGQEFAESVPPEDGRPAVLSDFRTRRDTYLDRLAGIAVFTDDALVKSAAKTFRQRLLDAPQDPGVTGAPDAAALGIALLTLYRSAAMEAATTAPAGKVEFDRIAK
jgi:hypothetical protein